MVNSEAFAKRLHQIMDYYKLSATAFADRIRVQRSSISHVLSGRNKPSLEFVMKIVKEFDEVELYWLLIGKGSFPEPTTPPSSGSGLIKKKGGTEQRTSKTENAELIGHLALNDKKIERIVIFYSDGSFKAYKNQ